MTGSGSLLLVCLKYYWNILLCDNENICSLFCRSSACCTFRSTRSRDHRYFRLNSIASNDTPFPKAHDFISTDFRQANQCNERRSQWTGIQIIVHDQQCHILPEVGIIEQPNQGYNGEWNPNHRIEDGNRKKLKIHQTRFLPSVGLFHRSFLIGHT